MCEKCIELDEIIGKYRHIKQNILDQITVDRAQELIAELEKRKMLLHSSDPQIPDVRA
jgi:hypothetical protein